MERGTPPSRLYGANGLRTGADGRVYVAQVAGSQISALDVGTGALETISPMGSDVVAPDDLAFDSRGNMYITEYYDGRVSVRGADGRTRVLNGEVPGANGITVHRDRLFIDECRIGGRVLELDLNGGAPRVLLENLPLPNALEVGPDGGVCRGQDHDRIYCGPRPRGLRRRGDTPVPSCDVLRTGVSGQTPSDPQPMIHRPRISVPLAWLGFALLVGALLALDALLRRSQSALPFEIFIGVGAASACGLAYLTWLQSSRKPLGRWHAALVTLAVAFATLSLAGTLYTIEAGIDSL